VTMYSSKSNSSTCPLVCRLDNVPTTSLSGGSVTKLLVTGLVGLEDLWRVFEVFGEVSNISMEGGAEAKVTFKHEQSLEAFQQSGEIQVGNFTLMVTRSKEKSHPAGPNWKYQRTFPSPPPVYGDMMYQPGYPAYPHYPIYQYQAPPPSPHYDAAILDMGHPEHSQQFYYGYPPPPPGDHLQPLSPVTPCPSPPPSYVLPTAGPQYLTSTSPTFFLPPSPAPSSSLASISGTSFVSEESSAFDQLVPLTPRPPTGRSGVELFRSPFKRFFKFTGVPVQSTFPVRSVRPRRREEEEASWYQAGDKWGHRRSNSFCEAEEDQPSEKVVGSRIVKTRKFGKSSLTGEPDILKGLGGLSLD